MKYLIEDTNKIVNERELRIMLMQEETDDIINNIDDYMDGNLDLGNQLHCIDTAKNGDIEEIIKMLENNWNIPVKRLDQNKYEIILILNTETKVADLDKIKNKINEIVEITEEKDLGIKKLAYKIEQKYEEGYYLQVFAKAFKEDITELEKYFRLESNILKFISIKVEE